MPPSCREDFLPTILVTVLVAEILATVLITILLTILIAEILATVLVTICYRNVCDDSGCKHSYEYRSKVAM